MAETKKAKGFSSEEKAAMRERARELKKASSDADAEKEVLAKIAKMSPGDRKTAERIHALVKAAAPQLTARTWYGMPAYAREDEVVCFFQSGQTFKTRYCTIGFSDKAMLDDGALWPTAYALMQLNAESEKQITALVKKAAG
ncbi:MAG: hypothetical protein IPJ65_37750 [Archangiaceae bacterium]|nr:hypothetical protein [Archangiaceae bacterium]